MNGETNTGLDRLNRPYPKRPAGAVALYRVTDTGSFGDDFIRNRTSALFELQPQEAPGVEFPRGYAHLPHILTVSFPTGQAPEVGADFFLMPAPPEE